jgi:hypothetical protein
MRKGGATVSTYRGLPPEALEILGLEPEDEDPDRWEGPYELPPEIPEPNEARQLRPVRVAEQPGERAS